MRLADGTSPKLPQAIEAEEQVVGSLIMAPDLIPQIAKIVRAGDFIDPAHRETFGAIMSLHRAGAPIDAVSVALQLRGKPPFGDRHAIATYLAMTGRAVATVAHVEHYAKQVRNAAGKARLYGIISDAAPHALNGKPALEVLSELKSDLDDFGRDFGDDSDPGDSSAAFNQWATSVLNREKPTMFRCGPSHSRLRDLEIGAGMVTTLAAPPSKGKSALAHQLLFDALLQPGQEDLRILIASVEMLPASILNRQLARFSGVGHGYIRHRTYDSTAVERLKASIEELRQLMPRIEFMPPPFSIERAAERAEDFGADIVLLDYLQRFSVDGGGDDARVQVNRAMTHCRNMADQGRAVLVISAVNRQGYQAETAGLASLRESGELEYASDAVYLMHLERDGQHSEMKAVLRCHKARDAELGEIPLKFNGSMMQFEAEPEHQSFSDLEGDFGPREDAPWSR